MIARVLEQFHYEILLIKEHIDIEILHLYKLSDSLNIGLLTGKMKRSGQLLNMPILVLLVRLVILQLVQAHIDRLYRVNGEQFNEFILVLLDCQGK